MESPQKLPVKKIQNILKYSGLGFQLAVLTVIAVISGQWLDKKLGLEVPIATIVLILVFISGFFYKLYLELFNTPK